MMKTEATKKRGSIVSLVVLIIALAVMIFSLFKLVPILQDYKGADDTYEQLGEDYVNTADIPAEINAQDDWAYVDIDFRSLKEINSDIIGWIRFDNLESVPIDYPILYSGDNDTYLRNDLYGEYHTAGSIFMEAVNSPDWSDYYNIIYGHNMKNGSMFGTLKKYKREEDFYDKNPCFTIYTEKGAFRYQIFAYEDVSDDSEIYTVGYAPDEEYQKQIDRLISGSVRDTGVVPTINDQIVVLSTCSTSGDEFRFVICAVCVDQRWNE